MSLSASELVERFGSPLYAYDGDGIRAAYRRLRAAVPEQAAIHYAMKANPSLGILALLVQEGAGLEIASEGELAAALRVGCPPERILYAGPGKRDAELAAALDAGVSGIHAESGNELRRIDSIAAGRGERVRCGVRVHVPWSAGETLQIIGGGEATKFGVSESEARASVASWLGLEHLEITGLHVFNASNVLDAASLIAGARRTLELACDLADAGLPLDRVDLGGGLGVSYSEEEEPLDIEAFGAGLAVLCGDIEAERGRSFDLALEPGRWLVAASGDYLSTVVDRKSCGGVDFAVLDGGVHHLLRPALVGQPHPARLVSRGGGGERRPVRLVGPLCTSLDSFGDHLLPPLQVGDVIAIERAGAYGFTEAMPQFLSHAVPAEVMELDGEVHLLRERRGADRHLDDQRLPTGLGSRS